MIVEFVVVMMLFEGEEEELEEEKGRGEDEEGDEELGGCHLAGSAVSECSRDKQTRLYMQVYLGNLGKIL
jgi:hypothetical protein